MRAKRLLSIVDCVSEWAGKLVSLTIIPLMLGMAYSIIVRFAFGNSPIWSYDFAYMVGGSFILLGGAYCLRYGTHVRIDIFYNRWPLRLKALSDVVLPLIFFFPVLILVLNFSIDHTIFAWQGKEKALETAFRPPIYPMKTVIPVALILLLLQGAAEWFRNLFILVRGRPL